MTEPFLGQITMVAFGFAPRGYAFCNGQQLPINQNQALFALLGTTFGGNGQTTFALPNFQGRAAVHVGAGHTQGEAGGETQHTLTMSELPMHAHGLGASAQDGDQQGAAGNLLAQTPNQIYDAVAPSAAMVATSVTPTGGSQPHPNVQPSLAIGFCIALQGIFPSQN